MHSFRRFTLSAAVACALTSPSYAFLASNELVVNRIDDQTFSIPYRGKSGASSFWCAAGDYVVRSLNMPYNTRIWRVSEPPRRSGEGITFSLSASGSASKTGLALVGPDDASLSAVFAQDMCRPRFFFRF